MKKNTALDPKKHLEPGLEIHSCDDLLAASQPRAQGTGACRAPTSRGAPGA
ncbi:hypothetical protein ACE0DR_12320 [Azotobacter sp. CWF10]